MELEKIITTIPADVLTLRTPAGSPFSSSSKGTVYRMAVPLSRALGFRAL
jgi:hypothetical protein